MVTPGKFRRLCLALEGTTEAPHAGRAAFRVERIYATLAPSAKSANLKFAPDEQALVCEMHPEAFEPVPGGWGCMGWTAVHLAKVSEAVLSQVLTSAWSGALPRPKSSRKRK